jgi:hypothetical protein
LEQSLAPIILFVYNRLWHTRQTVESLQKNLLATRSELHIFSDGPKLAQDTSLVQEVRNYINIISGFKKVYLYENASNQGLANSVIGGVTQIMNSHGKAIVMEDDMISAHNFLQFMNDALNTYEKHLHIFSISGYSYPISLPANYTKDVYLLPRASSWGWATWADRWEKADWQISDYKQFSNSREAKKTFARGGEDLISMLQKQQKGLISSWAIRWTYTHYKNKAYCMHLVKSKIHNIGTDNSGTHIRTTRRYDAEVSDDNYTLPSQITPDEEIIRNLYTFFKLSLLRKLINFFLLR